MAAAQYDIRRCSSALKKFLTYSGPISNCVIQATLNKKVRKPYNAADARHVYFPKFGGRGAPVVVSDGVRLGVSD